MSTETLPTGIGISTVIASEELGKYYVLFFVSGLPALIYRIV